MNGGFSKYDRKERTQSLYCYPVTDILKNKVGIKDAKALAKFEEDVTGFRQYMLEKEPIRGKFGITHLRNIHKFIFQDVYYFAGRFRLEDICKGDTFFCKSQFIEDRLKLLLIRLAKENHLQGLNADDFAQSTAAFVRCGGFTIRLYVGTLYEAAKRASLFFFEIMVTIRALSRAFLERHLR